MGIAINNFASSTEDRASGAQVIDGSLKVDDVSNHFMTRTPSTGGNRKTWTWAAWVKRQQLADKQSFMFAESDGSNQTSFGFLHSGATTPNGFYLRSEIGGTVVNAETEALFRDLSNFYHIVVACDTTQSAANDRVKVYINGTLQGWNVSPGMSQNADLQINHTVQQQLFGQDGSGDLDAYVSQVYFIDGQALGPEYFGYTDPLTNTWRPKKFVKQATPNNGTVWSNGTINGTPYNGSYTWDQAFNGNFTTGAAGGVNTPNEYNLTFTSGIPFSTGVTVYGNSNSADLWLNGNQVFMTSAIDLGGSLYKKTFTSIDIGSSTLTSVGMDAGITIYAYEVDGVILIDGDRANIGLNGFYLPFDGSAPIGEDQSGRGNNWTPVNFGGSAALDKATGALPILNTDGGGKVARVGVRTDENASSLVLALPLIGVKDDVSNQINSGSTTKTITSTNAVANYAFSNFYGGSWYFDGTDDGIAVTNTSQLDFGSDDFTIEMWFYDTVGDSSSDTLIATSEYTNSSSNNAFSVYSFGKGIRMFDRTGGAFVQRTTDGQVFETNTWNHFAWTRTGSENKMYVNGNLTQSWSNSITYTAGQRIFIGANDYNGGGGAPSDFEFNGYIQDVRVYKGVVKYTSNFIPASTNPDILPDTPSGVSYSSKLTKIIDGAVAFDGTGDYLSLADSDDWNFGSGDWTIEFYGNTKATTNGELTTVVTQSIYAASSDTSFYVGMGSYVSCWLSSGTNYQVQLNTSGVVVNDGNWHHIACVRNGTNIIIFVDGKNVANTTVSAEYTLGNSTQLLGIGSQNNNYFFPGFISNLRIINGTALYTSNFTPPTTTLTNVTNTKLLCCQSPSNVRLSPVGPNVGITTTTKFNSNFESIPTTVNGLTVTNNGSVTTTSAGTNSYGFTNCADFSGSNSLSVDLGTIPALSTIDIIFKATGTTDNKYLFGIGGVGMVRRSNSSFAWSNGSDTNLTTSEIADGNWHHLRVTPTRLWFDNTLIENNTTYQFINNNGAADGDNSGHMALGAFRNGSGTIAYNGAVDIGLVRVMPGVDLGAPSSYPITTNGTLSDTETIPSDGIIVARGDAAATNFNPFTTDINAVRGQETGYATWNPLDNAGTLSNGNLNFSNGASNAGVRGTISLPNSGKFYAEAVTGSLSSGSSGVSFGFATQSLSLSASPLSTGNYTIYSDNIGRLIVNGSAVSTSLGTFAAGTLLQIAYDGNTGNGWFGKENIWYDSSGGTSGNPSLGLNPTFTTSSTLFLYSLCFSNSVAANFGQKPFKFPPPEGFQPLNAANARPSTVIARPDQYVGIVTYTGNGSTQTISGLEFSPDLAWIKVRSTNNDHMLYDTVRGDFKKLSSNSTDEENTNTSQLSFNSDGFSLGSANKVNALNETFVAWTWKAGGNSNTFNIDDVGYDTASAAGLTGGTITPTGASVNTKSGFSIVTYNGSGVATVGHGLNAKPSLIIIKNRDNSYSWQVYHESLGATKYLILQSTNNAQTSTDRWNDTEPTSSVFTIGTNAQVGGNCVAYCWAEIPGFSKFGSYVGTNTTDNVFIDLGFKPAFLMIKNITSGGSNLYHWCIYDNERSTYNPSSNVLWPSSALEENNTGLSPKDSPAGNGDIDFLSNGFKVRSSGSAMGGPETYIYAAWAEAPSINLYGAQANAR